MVVAHEMQRTVHEKERDRSAVGLGPLRADDHVSQLPRQPVGERLAAVQREREHVGRLGLAPVGGVQLRHLREADQHDSHVAVRDALGGERRRHRLPRGRLVERVGAAVLHLDVHGHSRVPSPVCSACSA
jgi:hypothetical protein